MSKPFEICQIDHLVLRVRDLDEMRRFYCEVLGCTVEKERPELGLVQLRAGRSLIDLADKSGRVYHRGETVPDNDGKNLEHFCVRVDSFDESAIRAHLITFGVVGGKTMNCYGADGWGPSMYISDPEGNTIELKGPPFEKKVIVRGNR